VSREISGRNGFVVEQPENNALNTIAFKIDKIAFIAFPLGRNIMRARRFTSKMK
jgi:hypothetical protein